MRVFLLLALLVPPLATAGEPATAPAPTTAPPATAPAPTPPAARAITFAPREDVQVGWTFLESSTWTVKGENEVKVAGATVRKGPIDTLSSHLVHVRIDEVQGGRPHTFVATVREQVSREDGEAEDLAIDGLTLHVSGPAGKRDIDRADGKRLKRKQRKWLERQFGGSPDGQDIDPISLLIPPNPVRVGDTWDLSLDAIQGFFGEDRVTIDHAASHATATLQSVDVTNGVETGHIAFDVLVVPSAMRNAELTEASMKLTGIADLPVRGDLPYFAYDVHTDMRFVGTFIRGAIRAQVDLVMNMHGVDARTKP